MDRTKKTTLLHLLICIVGVWASLFGVICFQKYLLMALPLGLRMVVMIFLYWLIMAVPVIFVLVSHVKPAELGFTKDKLPAQILVGIGVGAAMSLTLTLVPTLLGFGDWVSSGKNYTEWWQFVYEFIYCIGAVGVTEELIFRGYFVHKLRQIKDSSLFAGTVSSVLFGLFHIFGGNVVQVIFTAVIGGILYVCREKVKHCTLLSLIIAHGVYDALICVWSFVF